MNGSAEKADLDLAELEDSLSRDALDLILIETLKIQDPDGYYRILEGENYSILFRSLALLMATSDALSLQPSISLHQ